MPTTLTGRRLCTSQGAIDHPVIVIDQDGLIASIHSDPANSSEDVLTSTFFDIHTHGAANYDLMNVSPAELGVINRFLATKGVGHYLATTVTAPIDQTLRSLDALANAVESRSAANEARPIGIHLEGPFISHARKGVHPPADILPPDIALFDRFYEAARGQIRIITIAPEIPGALALIEHAASLGVKVSIGHTDATSEEAQAAIAAGARSATHTFNAMRPLDHRAPGVIATVLDDDRLFAELICDGIHVAPEVVRLWFKAKGPEKAILITDSMSATGMPDGTYTLGTFQVQVKDGRAMANGSLAGSVLTMDRAVANLQRFTGLPLDTAVRLASHNPAALLGLEEVIGNTDAGKTANFNVFDASGQLQGTILNGVRI
ncbi:N-acetylglucosamine-6-phosphate deacetylase [Edaphobacter paludis]|uniref:N-acetylglucosamine-6-phosphate deacetylase n=1 Tax=Edaphobacter paludis TaxID=3035702 RepID=A0AAU7D423_9BACT